MLMPSRRIKRLSKSATTYDRGELSRSSHIELVAAHDHPADADDATPYKTPSVSYAPLQNIRPAKFRNKSWEDVAEGDYALGS